MSNAVFVGFPEDQRVYSYTNRTADIRCVQLLDVAPPVGIGHYAIRRDVGTLLLEGGGANGTVFRCHPRTKPIWIPPGGGLIVDATPGTTVRLRTHMHEVRDDGSG